MCISIETTDSDRIDGLCFFISYSDKMKLLQAECNDNDVYTEALPGNETHLPFETGCVVVRDIASLVKYREVELCFVEDGDLSFCFFLFDRFQIDLLQIEAVAVVVPHVKIAFDVFGRIGFRNGSEL